MFTNSSWSAKRPGIPLRVSNIEAIGVGEALARRARDNGWHLPKSTRRQRKLRKGKRRREELMSNDYARYPHLCPVALSLHRGVRSRATMFGIPFAITQKWLLERLVAGKCEVTGIAFDLHSTGRSNFVPSVDQIKPGAGYTKENSQLVIWGYNAAKSTGTHEDVMRMARALVAAEPAT